jgi:hypothetical protein
MMGVPDGGTLRIATGSDKKAKGIMYFTQIFTAKEIAHG